MATLTLDAFSDVMDTGSDRLQRVLRKRLSEQGRVFKQAAARNAAARFRRDTGATAGAVRARLHRSKMELLMGFDTDKSPGGLIQDTGGTIRPTRGEFLFIPQPDGSFRVAREVTIKATNWLSDAWETLQRTTPAALEGALSDALGST